MTIYPPYRITVSLKQDFGAVGDGVHDDWPAVWAAAQLTNVNIFVDPGTYRCSKIVVPNVQQQWYGVPGASIFSWDGSFANLFWHSDGISLFRVITDCTFQGIKFTNTSGVGSAFGVNLGDASHIPARITYLNCEGDHCSLNISGGPNHTETLNHVHDSHSDRAIGCTTSNPGTTFDNTGSVVTLNKVENCTGVAILAQSILNGEVAFNVVESSGSAGVFTIDMNASRDTSVAFNNLQGCVNGILFEQSSGNLGTCSIVGNTFVGSNNNAGVGIQIWPNTGSGAYASILIANNTVSTCLIGLYIVQQTSISLVGNTVTNIGQNSVYLHRTSGNFTSAIVRSNTFTGWAIVNGTQAAVLTESANVYVTLNHFDGTGGTTPIGISGIAGAGEIRQNTIIAVTTPYNSINAACLITGNTTGTKLAASAITVTASPFIYTNNDISDNRVTVVGGTVSSVTLNATATGVTSGMFVLHPTDTLTVTYTVAPTLNKIPL